MSHFGLRRLLEQFVALAFVFALVTSLPALARDAEAPESPVLDGSDGVLGNADEENAPFPQAESGDADAEDDSQPTAQSEQERDGDEPESAAQEEDDPVLENAEAEEPGVGPQPMGVETIKVTARRREESIQDTPISMTVFSEETLAERGIQDIRELARFTPNLIFDTSAAQSNNALIFIRGVGQTEGTINAEPKVGMYIDGVYQARPLGSIITLFDLERIEVLRGPQGTLYGKNAIGGAINIISNKPQPHPEATMQLEFGNLMSRNVRLMGNMPVDVLGLGDKLFARADFLYEYREGYLNDVNLNKKFSDHDLLGGRGALRFTPLEELDMNISYTQTSQPTRGTRGECEIIASRTDSNFFDSVAPGANGTAALGGDDFVTECDRSHGLTTSTDVPPGDDLQTKKIHGDLVWDTPEIRGLGSLVVRSVSGYQNLDHDLNLDFDSTALPLLSGEIRDDFQWQFSQELIVSGTAFADRMQWTAGLFYLREEYDGPENDAEAIVPNFEFRADSGDFFPLGAEIASSRSFLHQTAAGYAFGTFDITDSVTLNAGFRYAWEKKDFTSGRELTICSYSFRSGFTECEDEWPADENGDISIGLGPTVVIPASTFASPSDQWQAPTGNIGVSWAARENLNLYVGYQRGFTSGGFNFLGDDVNGVPNRFEPEFLDGVELGVRSTWLEGRLVANATYFWSYYHDRQQRVQEARNLEGEGNLIGFADVIINVGDATLQGGELELNYLPVEGLLLRAGLGLTFASYDELLLLNAEATEEASEAARQDPDLPDDTIVLVYDDATNNALPYTPKVNFSVGAMYNWPVTESFDITPSVDFSWRSKIYFDVRNTPELSQGDYGLLNARLNFRHHDSKVDLVFWAKNLTDETYRTGGFSLQNYVSRYYGLPRTFGLTFTKRFYGD
jgi:iron complex outermembrane receptor protein